MTRTRSASSSAVGRGAGAHLTAKHGGRIAVAAGTLVAAVTDNIGAALGVSHRLGAGGDSIATFARDAFVGSMRGALWIAVGMAVVARSSQS